MIDGNISSVGITSHGHVLGNDGSYMGDKGGGVFLSLIGMHVGRELAVLIKDFKIEDDAPSYIQCPFCSHYKKEKFINRQKS